MTDQSIADPIQIIKKNLLISNPSSFHSAYEAEVSIDSINDASFHSFNSVHTSNGTSSQLSFATPKSRTFSPINKKQNTSPQSNASPSDLNDRIERTHTSPIVNQIAIQSDSKEEYHNSAHNRHIGSYHSQLQSKRKSINVQSESISIPKTRSTHKDLLTKDNDSFPRTTTNSSLHSSQDDRAMSESLSKTQRLSLVAKNLNHEISGRSPSHYGRSFKGTAHGLLGGIFKKMNFISFNDHFLFNLILGLK